MHECPGDCALYQLQGGEENLEELMGREYLKRVDRGIVDQASGMA